VCTATLTTLRLRRTIRPTRAHIAAPGRRFRWRRRAKDESRSTSRGRATRVPCDLPFPSRGPSVRRPSRATGSTAGGPATRPFRSRWRLVGLPGAQALVAHSRRLPRLTRQADGRLHDQLGFGVQSPGGVHGTLARCGLSRAFSGKHCRMRLAALNLFYAVTTFACSSSSPSTVDPSKKLNTLSTGDQESLCDWTAQEQGGYGTIITCDAASTDLEVETDQAKCIADVSPHFSQPTCTANVGDWMTCVKWRLSNWCSATPPVPTGQCAAIQTGCFGSSLPDAGTD
jgi:hypothetical protein